MTPTITLPDYAIKAALDCLKTFVPPKAGYMVEAALTAALTAMIEKEDAKIAKMFPQPGRWERETFGSGDPVLIIRTKEPT